MTIGEIEQRSSGGWNDRSALRAFEGGCACHAATFNEADFQVAFVAVAEVIDGAFPRLPDDMLEAAAVCLVALAHASLSTAWSSTELRMMRFIFGAGRDTLRRRERCRVRCDARRGRARSRV